MSNVHHLRSHSHSSTCLYRFCRLHRRRFSGSSCPLRPRSLRRATFDRLSFKAAVASTVAFLLTLPYFSLTGAGINFAGLVTAAIAAAALCLRTWRRTARSPPLQPESRRFAMALILSPLTPSDTVIISHHPDWWTRPFLPARSSGGIHDSIGRGASASPCAIVCSLLHQPTSSKEAQPDLNRPHPRITTSPPTHLPRYT